MNRKDLTEALRKERDLLVTQIFKRFAETERLLLRAMDEHDAGNLPEARILMNEALDIECDVTGDAKILAMAGVELLPNRPASRS